MTKEEVSNLAEGLAVTLLSQWLAIENNETRLQGIKYIEQAQELADYLHIIGYRLVDTSKLTVLSDEEKLACSLVSKCPLKDVKDVIDETCSHMLEHTKQELGG